MFFYTNASEFYTVFKRPGNPEKRDRYSYVKYIGTVKKIGCRQAVFYYVVRYFK